MKLSMTIESTCPSCGHVQYLAKYPMLMSLKDAGHELDLSVEFLRKLIASGILPAYMRKIGVYPLKYMVKPEDIWLWIELSHPRVNQPRDTMNPTVRKIYDTMMALRKVGKESQRKQQLAQEKLTSSGDAAKNDKEDNVN